MLQLQIDELQKSHMVCPLYFSSKIILSVTVLYGYYVIGCESCGMSDDVLEPIIGQRCLTRSLSLIQENGIRPCRHRTMGLERCNRTDSNG